MDSQIYVHNLREMLALTFTFHTSTNGDIINWDTEDR